MAAASWDLVYVWFYVLFCFVLFCFVLFCFVLRQKTNQQKNSSWLVLFMFEPRWSSSLPGSPGASKIRLASEVSW